MPRTRVAGEPLLEATALTKRFPLSSGLVWQRRHGAITAVDRVDLTIGRGEILGLVGESGCGKTTLGRMLLRLIDPSEGTLRFDGIDLLSLSPRAMREQRRRMQIVFQDPYSSLDPYKRVGNSIAEPLRIFRIGTRASRRARVDELLDLVGLTPEHAGRYPWQFSGGQRQRISIARALALSPSFIVCDEPVSALDVSVQAQIINLLQRLRRTLGLTYLFVSHDLGVVRHIADRVAVMYLGRVVELGPARKVFAAPRHPYTKALIDAVPVPDPTRRRRPEPLTGEIPSAANPPPGCRFSTRCAYVQEVCRHLEPDLRPTSSGTLGACHFAEELAQVEAVRMESSIALSGSPTRPARIVDVHDRS
jgi:oligopeptide/dipeptide ABC transporter ATP-binding protein